MICDTSILAEFDLGDLTIMHTYAAPMQSLNQSPGVTDPAEARSAWPNGLVLPAIEEQVRTNNAITIADGRWALFNGGILQVRSTGGLVDTRAYGEN